MPAWILQFFMNFYHPRICIPIKLKQVFFADQSFEFKNVVKPVILGMELAKRI